MITAEILEDSPTPAEQAESRQRAGRLDVPLLVALVLLLYGRTLGFPFLHYDDDVLISQNQGLYPFRSQNLATFWTDGHAGVYMPVTYTYWIVLAQIAALRGQPTMDGAPALAAWPFHLGNVALFLLSTLLVLHLLLRLTGDRPASLCGAVIFAVHPMQVETVAWASEAKGLLALVFGLGAVAMIVHAGQNGAAWSRQHWRRFLFGASALYVLALLSKPSAVSIPLVAGVLSLTLLRAEAFRRLRRWLTAWIVLGILVAIHADRIQRPYRPTNIPLSERPLVIAEAATSYLRMLLVPEPRSAEYGRHPLSLGDAESRRLWRLAWIGIGGLVLLRLRASPGENLAAVGVIAAGLLPVLGFVPFGYQEVSIVADRYTQYALFGLALAVAHSTKARSSVRSYVDVAIAAVVLSLFTWEGVKTWRSDTELIEASIAVNPRSRLFRTNRAVVSLRAGNVEAAIEDARRAARVAPVFLPACQNLAAALYRQGNVDEALSAIERGLDRSPSNTNLLTAKAEILSRQRRFSEAVATLEELDRWDPSGPTKLRLAATLALADRDEDALRLFREVLNDPFEPPRDDLLIARTLSDSGDDAKAIERYRSIMGRWGPLPAALREMAWILATSSDDQVRNPVLAGQLIRPLVKNDRTDSARILDVLAATQAANGNFHQAVLTAEQAIRRAREAGNKELAHAIEGRVALYREKTPFRRSTGGG